MSEYKYKAIIFDFDGVLVDSVDIKGQAFRRMYEQHGGDIGQQVYEYHMQHGGVSRREKFKHFSKLFFNKKLEAEELESMCDQFSNIVTDMVANASWIKGAKQFLEDNHENIGLHVASATPIDELLDIMRQRNMCHYFQSIKGSPAQKRDNIREIMDKERLNDSEVVMIGDAKTDYDAALHNGIDFVGVGKDPYINKKASLVINDLTVLNENL
jgi:phosphoglycolate phosphatase-like HAD superfamily hydrolase